MKVLEVEANATASLGHVTDYFLQKPLSTLVRVLINQCDVNPGRICETKVYATFRNLLQAFFIEFF